MLITHKNILDRFSQNLEWATEIDLATAWATPNRGLCALRRKTPPPVVRAIVGLWGNITHPNALRELADMGELRAGPASNERRRFHPKIYIFRGAGRSLAWIGSANFTCPGFGGDEKVLGHEEALFETSDTKAAECWFNQLRARCTVLDEVAINFYADHWRKHRPPQQAKTWDPASLDESPPVWLLNEVDDWRSYVAALKQCDQWWERWSRKHHPNNPWSVLGERNSWRETIRKLGSVVRGDWHDLGDGDQSRLLGLGKDNWALLGRMRGSAKPTVFGRYGEKIQTVIRRLCLANDADFPDAAIEAYASLVDLDGIRKGIASRLLTLAKPDRFVSLNDGSRNGLATFFDLAPSTLGTTQKYGCLLEKINDLAWFRDPPPKDARNKEIWGMRAALLDCFVYKDAEKKRL